MALFSIDRKCESCGYEEYGALVEKEEKDGTWPCTTLNCKGKLKRAYLTPIRNTRASFVDGQKRKGFRELAQASRIEADMLDQKPKDRGEYQKEIDRLKGVKK